MVWVLIGNCLVVVVKIFFGDVKVCVILVGNLLFIVQGCSVQVDVVVGVEVIMKVVDGCGKLDNVVGEVGINIGGMFEYVCQIMVEFINKLVQEICIQDLLVVDMVVLVSVIGGFVGEFLLEQVVGIVLMVKLDCLQMVFIVCEIEYKLQIVVQVGGVEVEVVIFGVFIIFGIMCLLVIFDLGVGLIDVFIINVQGEISVIYLVGVGDMVMMIIVCELGFEDCYLVEEIKKYLLVKVESLFYLCYEDGSVQFFLLVLLLMVFVCVCVVKLDELVFLFGDLLLEKVCVICCSVKLCVFIINVL